MAAPAGGEVAIYDAVAKNTQHRLLIGLDYPARTASKTESFAAALDPVDWMYTQYNNAPDVSGGTLNLQMYGGSLCEYVTTRPHWFPDSTTIAFSITFVATFPLDDPVYNVPITVGGLENEFAQNGEPFRVIQRGSLHTASVGSLYHSLNATVDSAVANDKAAHTYVIAWDPDAANPLTITRDGSTLYAGEGYRPYYVTFGGIIMSDNLTGDGPAGHQVDNTPLGSPSNPSVCLKIESFTVAEYNSEGYETRTYPSWTSVNAGGDIDTAADGERFSLDGETWAKVPTGNIKSISVTKGRATRDPEDSLSVSLVTPSITDPDTYPNIFSGMRLVNRPVVWDTRIQNDTSGSWTAWKRQFAGVIDSVEWTEGEVSFDARDLPSYKLDTLLPLGFTSLSPLQGVAEPTIIESVKTSLRVDQIFGALIDMANTLSGSILGETTYDIGKIDHAPASIGTGGQSLLPLLQEWCDRCAQEMWRQYSTSDYGVVRINTWTLTGTAGYTFKGKGSSLNKAEVLPGSFSMSETRRDGVGNVLYRNDSPTVGKRVYTTETMDFPGPFPWVPYPPNDRTLTDSFAALADFGLSTLVVMEDKDGERVVGGVSKFRYHLENQRRRVVRFEVVGQDWIEPADVIAIDDPDGLGITSSEVLVVDAVEVEIDSDGILTTQVSATFADFVNSIRRTV